MRQPKRFALLVYLLLEGNGGDVRRDWLLAMFWPESDGPHARGSLRQALRFLRKHLGPDVISRRGAERVGLSLGRYISDVNAFETLLKDGKAAEAMALYGGHLLEGFYVEGAPAFEIWLASQRTVLRRTATGAARSLAILAEECGDAAAVSFWAYRVASFVPHDERTVCTVMELLDRIGDRAGALDVYRRLARWLEDEFDSAPSPETQALLETIKERTTPFAEQDDDTGPVLWFPPRSGSRRRVGSERRSGRGHEQSSTIRYETPRGGKDRRGAASDRRTDTDQSGNEPDLSAGVTSDETD